MQNDRPENCISSQAADRLIAAHDGDVALLYIYITRTACRDPERAAHDLCRTMREISEAWEKLERMGVLAADSGPAVAAPLPPAEELPQYRAEDIVRRSREDGNFSVIVAEASKVIGRSLGVSDMKTLFGIYDYLALPTEVIMELLNYCGELFTEKFGSGRRPSARAIEKEAYAWVNREIVTLEQAEEYIREQKARRGSVGAIKTALDIRGRELTASESKYICGWLDMGFNEESVAIAYDRTVTNTGSLKWPYMDKILHSWHDKGLKTPEDIEEKDGRRRRSEPPAAKADAAADISDLQAALTRIRG